MQGETQLDKQVEMAQQKVRENMSNMLNEISNLIQSKPSVSYALDHLEELFKEGKQSKTLGDYNMHIQQKISEIVHKIAEKHEPVQLERLLEFLQRQLQYTKQQQYQQYLLTIFDEIMSLQAKITSNFDNKDAPSDLFVDVDAKPLNTNDQQLNQNIKYLSVIIRGAFQLLQLAVNAGFVKIACQFAVSALETCEHFYRIDETKKFLELFKTIPLKKNLQDDKWSEIALANARTDITSVLHNLKLFEEAYEQLKQNGSFLKYFCNFQQKDDEITEEEQQIKQNQVQCIINHLKEACKHFSLQKKHLQLLVALIQVLNISPLIEQQSEAIESLFFSSLLWVNPINQSNKLRQRFNDKFTLKSTDQTILMVDDLPVWWDVTNELKEADGILGKAKAYARSFCAQSVGGTILSFIERLSPTSLPWGGDEQSYLTTMLDDYRQAIQLNRAMGSGVSEVVHALLRNSTLLGLVREAGVEAGKSGDIGQPAGRPVSVAPLLKRIYNTLVDALGGEATPGIPQQRDVKKAFLTSLRCGILQKLLGLRGCLSFQGNEATVQLVYDAGDELEENEIEKCSKLLEFDSVLRRKNDENIQACIQGLINSIQAKMTFNNDDIYDNYLTHNQQMDSIQDREDEISQEQEEKQIQQQQNEEIKQQEQDQREKATKAAEQRKRAVDASVSNNSKLCLQFINQFKFEIGERDLGQILETQLLKMQKEFKTFLNNQTEIQKSILEAKENGDNKVVEELEVELKQLQRPTPPDLWFRKLNERTNEYFNQKHEKMTQDAQITAENAEFQLYCQYKNQANEKVGEVLQQYNNCIAGIKAHPEAKFQYQLDKYNKQLEEIKPYIDLNTKVLQMQQEKIDKKHIQNYLYAFYGAAAKVVFQNVQEAARNRVKELQERKQKQEEALMQIRNFQAFKQQKQGLQGQSSYISVRKEDVPTESEVKKYQSGGFLPGTLREKFEKAIKRGICAQDGTVKPEVIEHLKQQEKRQAKQQTVSQQNQTSKKQNFGVKIEAEKSKFEVERQRVLSQLEKDAAANRQEEMPSQKEIDAYRKGSFIPKAIRDKVEGAIKKGLIPNISLMPLGDKQ